MKKIISVVLALVLVFTLSVSAFALSIPDEVTTENGTATHEVKGHYVAGQPVETVISVNIYWGSMNFTYTDGSLGVWNPVNQQYENAIDPKWECATDADKIGVENLSNCDITASFAYNKKPGFDVTGEFEILDTGVRKPLAGNEISLDRADVNDPLFETVKDVYLKVGGKLAPENTTDVAFGDITVTINEAVYA